MTICDKGRIEEAAEKFRYVFAPPGRYVNDHCFYIDGETVHLFYIDGEKGKGCYDIGNETIIGHAASRDLVNWEALPPALSYNPGIHHEERGIFAPYVIKKGDSHIMLYSSHNMEKAQYICMAESKDLNEWDKDKSNPVIRPHGGFAFWDEKKACSCRDPHVFYENGKYHIYWVADMSKDKDTSCIALSISYDMRNFIEIGPVMEMRHSFDEAFTMKTESPCVIKRHGRYYLFFRHGNGTKYRISENPEDFSRGKTFYLGPSHASEIFEYGGGWHISSCSREPADVGHVTDRSRGLYMAGLDFSKVHPVITG